MKIAIIGGYGKMGKWFARFLLRENREVILIGRNPDKLCAAAQELGGVEATTDFSVIGAADAVIISVSIESFEEVVKRMAAYTRPGQVILDVTSIKTMPVEVMQRYIRNGVALGTHPMFGPGALSLKGQNIVLTPTSSDENALADRAAGYLEARGATISRMSPQQHDELMTVTLGLAHFIGIAAADTLLGLDKLDELKKVAGTSFKTLLMLARGVITRDPEFYSSLQMYLPGLAEMEQLFQQKAQAWADLVKNRDRNEFICRMKQLNDKLEQVEPGSGEAFEQIYRASDA